MKTLLRGGVILTCDEAHAVFEGGDLVFEDDVIVYVGPAYEGDYDVRISVAGKLLMPGLINAHTHSSMSLFRGLADDVDLMVFLQERVWPRELQLLGDDVYAGSVLSSIEMLKSGVTTYVDMYFFDEDLRRAALDTGARALITPTVLNAEVWEPRLGNWDEQLRRGVEFCVRVEGEAGRIHTGLGPHAPYTVPMRALEDIAFEARRMDLPVNIHLVETRGERDAFEAEWNRSTASVLEDRGFFDGKVIAAHSVWLDPGDIEIYAARHVGVAHCPVSNAKLGAGVAPVSNMLAHGVYVGLGTDGPATNNNLNLWEEMRLAPLLAKVIAYDQKSIPATEALWMATRLGAKAIFLPQIGVLQEGFKADVVMLRLDDTTTVPIFSPATYIDHVVYSMGRELVDSVWVNGQQVVKDGEVITVDEAEARRAVQDAAMAVSERMGR